MTCDKTQLMAGEKTHLTLTLRYKNLEDYDIEELKIENFQTTLVENKEIQENNNTWLVTQRYALLAQKAGSFTLTSPIAHLESIAPQHQDRYNRNKYLVKTDVQAKPCTLNISPLPQGLKVTGTYTLTTEVNKQKVKSGEAVHFTVHLKGEGNIKDLSFFTLRIPHTTVYETSTSTNKKEFDIVSDSNYSIPALNLHYYNQSSKSTELLSSQAFHIEVITTPSPQKSKAKVLLFLLLTLVGLLYYLHRLFASLSHLDKKTTFIKALKRCKSKEALLAKVSPYLGKDRGLDRLIFRLEGVESGEYLGVKREIIKSFNTKFAVVA
jgi:hypothetical protein